MKKKIIILVSVLAAAVIAVCVLMLTGVISLPHKRQEQTGQAVAYIDYMNSCMLIDKNMTVTGSSQEVPEGLPKITGLSFDQIVMGSKLEPKDKEAAKYAMKLVDCIQKNSLDIAEVYVSVDLSATMYVGNIKILLGQDVSTEEKLHDLRDFYDDVKELSGVLDMTELSKNNLGYSFKKTN